MIKSIEINNFKSIKKKFFPLRNLNLLLGLNGMGKSSFIQHLLAFRQSPNILTDGKLHLKGEYVKLGNTKDALYQFTTKGQLTTKICFDEEHLDFTFDYISDADYFTSTAKIDSDCKSSKIKEEPLFTNSFQYLNANRTEPKSINAKDYSHVVEQRNVGAHGEFTANYLETYGDEQIEIDGLTHPDSMAKDSVTGNTIVNKSLVNQTNLWMGEISPAVKIRTRSVSSDYVILEYAFEQPNVGTTNYFKPENVGFGITYGLPVVVAILKSKPGDLLIIENPEAHIHPRGQAEIGKLMALAAMNGVQIIVETHSDHILNGIRVAVKEKLISQDKVQLFYFEKVVEQDEQFSKITNIEIDQKGELSEYPKNMLDEWNEQLMRLL